MNIFCPIPPNDCSDPSVPVLNYSSEVLDSDAFFGRAYNPGLQPPLGSPWESTGCIGTCRSEVSQEEADQCAARQVIQCLSGEWPVLEDNPVITRDRTTVTNEEQSADFTCPDGSVFTYTIPAGTVEAFSLAAANTSALSMAQNGAINNRICIGELSPTVACAGNSYLATVAISCPRIGEQGISTNVTIAEGVLPPGLGLEFDETSFTISGEASSAGQYDFTVQVDILEGGFLGSFTTKQFSITVVEISPVTLPNGQVGNSYSQTLTLVGASGTVAWSAGSGFPAGLSLNPTTGEITGVPTTEGTAAFTITATDEDSGVQCSKDYDMVIDPGVDFSELVWTRLTLEQTGTGTAAFSPDGGTGNDFVAACTCGANSSGSIGRTTYDADLVYAGPNMPCSVDMTILNNDLFADPGVCSLTCSYFLNAILQTSVTMAQGFNGLLQLPFTAAAGAIKIRFDMFAAGAPGNPDLAISCNGSVVNV